MLFYVRQVPLIIFYEVKSVQIEKIACPFRIDGNPVSWKEFGSGHINYTVKVLTDAGKEYVLQRINKYVFKDPVKVMSNVGAVTAFLRDRVSDPRMALHYISTYDDLYYFMDEEVEYWRMYDFIGGFCLDAPESEEDFYQSALAFGRFQHMLSEFPAHTLYETIPEFHNTIDRYRQLKESIATDACGRLESVKDDVAFLMEREELGCILQRLRESGELPLRVTHNDTKLNNVLLDKDTRTSLCVLDLDTVMPGLSLYDFGDSIRFGAATAPEDEPDTSKMSMDLHLFEVYTKGFLEAATSLTDKEVELLPVGAFVITLELATRFMKDYLDGDLYFKTAYPEHNLVRARAQMKLAADMQSKFDEMNRIVADVAKQVR